MAATAAATAAIGASPPDGATARRLPLWPFVTLALVVVLAGYAAYRLLGYDKPVATAETSTTAPGTSSEAPAAEAPADGSTAGATASPTGATAPGTASPEGVPPENSGATGATPASEAGAAPAAPAAKAKPVHPKPAPKPATPPVAPRASAPAAAAPMAPAAVAPAPPKDRWAQMLDAIASQCGKETFLNKVICEQKVRIQYCDGYWGKVSQCPMGMRDPDKGSGS
jgi:hypothetical protein